MPCKIKLKVIQDDVIRLSSNNGQKINLEADLNDRINLSKDPEEKIKLQKEDDQKVNLYLAEGLVNHTGNIIYQGSSSSGGGEGGGGGVTSYEKLSNLPSINYHKLIGNKSGSELELVDAKNTISATRIAEICV